MDRFRQKSKKEKPMKHVDKEKSPLFITDVKTIKENIKIKEILRSVKMNSSMRIKAPRGSVVMNNNDFIDAQDDHLSKNNEEQDVPSPDDLQEAKNSDLVNQIAHDNEEVLINHQEEFVKTTEPLNDLKPGDENIENCNIQADLVQNSAIAEAQSIPPIEITEISPDGNQENTQNHEAEPRSKRNSECPAIVKTRERKLSLDHTMLTRREGLSQSEMDLHSIGKSPLERKSSFFRKKMDSFLKNTTEIFKRQSLSSKSQPVIRRGSMSVSLQSLNEKTTIDGDEYGKTTMSQEVRGSATSVASGSTLGASETESAGSHVALSSSQPLAGDAQGSPNSVNETYNQDSLLNSRAISMSSGLDSAFGQRRRKTSRSNRVTWVASEGLTNYLRRLTQDEAGREMHASHSYQDFSSIPEDMLPAPRLDSKGRRLSYQRAVSGEDPVLPPRYQDSSLRRRPLIPEHSEANYELANLLAEFTRNGVPPLSGFNFTNISDPAYSFLIWAESTRNIEDVYDWKTLSPNEEARQAVIRELIRTEADYIRHLTSVVEVFMAAAHVLQDNGKMLEVDTSRLFSNIPDVLNASLAFWEITMYPMLADAVNNGHPYNTEFLSPGFCRFRDLFSPYEKYVSEQSKALDYLRSLSNNSDFMTYLAWCHAQKSCNRLQLSDMMAKPMQRLTKYSLILRRIITHTDAEPERTSLIAMESFAKNYVLDLNRSIRQREEIEKLVALAGQIDVLEMEFKDDDMDRYFRMFSQLNLKAPMLNCLPTHSRTLIHEGDLRFKDNMKEAEVRVFLLTDMMLICKKLSKGSNPLYKLIRPKFMVDRMIYFPKLSSRNSKDIMVALIFVVVDEVGTSCHCFTLTELAKEPNPQGTIKIWEQKLREAKLTYDLGVWFAKNPSRDLSEVEMDSSSDYGISINSGTKAGVKQSSDDLNIEREARERVAAMLHRSMGASTEYDFSQASMNTDSFDATGDGSGGRPPGTPGLRHPMHRNSTGGSSRNSRLSSFQQSTSAASHDEPQAGPSSSCHYRAGTSVEHLIPPLNPDDVVTSITVNVVSESESETVVPSHLPSVSPPKLASRSASAASHNTLRVQPQSGVLALVHSLPDLTLDPSPPRHSPSPSPLSASEKLYQSHQELLQRNRLSASRPHHQYLSPDHRGTSYPPPSPTRASLKRGLAFSDSFKNPPLSKMGHVNSQSQLQAEPGPSTSGGSGAIPKSEKGAVNPMLVPTKSTEKEKKKHLISSRNKGGGSSGGSGAGTPGRPRKDDKAD